MHTNTGSVSDLMRTDLSPHVTPCYARHYLVHQQMAGKAGSKQFTTGSKLYGGLPLNSILTTSWVKPGSKAYKLCYSYGCVTDPPDYNVAMVVTARDEVSCDCTYIGHFEVDGRWCIDRLARGILSLLVPVDSHNVIKYPFQ